MKTKLKTCSGCGELKMIWKNHEGNKYCKFCWTKQTMTSKGGVAKTKPLSSHTSKPIARRSPKRAKQEREYSKLRTEFLISSPHCQAKLPAICTHNSTDVHHKAGRIGDLLTDKRYWLAVCRPCHNWLELHPIEAKELGYSINRLNLNK